MDNSYIHFADSKTLKRLAEIIQNFTHTNIFPVALKDDKYEQINATTYKKENEHIEVPNIRGEWRYRNLNCRWDTGNIVQFIANRWNGTFRDCNSIAILYASAFIAKKYYQDLKKQLHQEHKPAQRKIYIDKKDLKKRH